MDEYSHLFRRAAQLSQDNAHLFIVSLIIVHLAEVIGFGGQPSLSRFVLVTYSFHFSNKTCFGVPWDCSVIGIFFYTPNRIILSPHFVSYLWGGFLGLHAVSFCVVALTS